MKIDGKIVPGNRHFSLGLKATIAILLSLNSVS